MGIYLYLSLSATMFSAKLLTYLVFRGPEPHTPQDNRPSLPAWRGPCRPPPPHPPLLGQSRRPRQEGLTASACPQTLNPHP